jgi:hypothetical protein
MTFIMQKFQVINTFYYIINMKLPQKKLKSYFHLIENNSLHLLYPLAFSKNCLNVY